ncbi:MAG TPA: Re/Si-specific NAD(P)(+) transhydrogenase subunit alpha [Phaeodactylibacter sp.]|nr:Re/Si-specific NAD(P)(+) transhydrogenase subunit alpha [Phaeodactylibacter sp.]
MKLAIPKETDDPRVALTPDAVGKLSDLGFDILLEHDAGAEAFFPDEAYEGAKLMDRQALLQEAELILSIHPLADEELKQLAEDTVVISQFQPFNDKSVVDKLRRMKLRALSLDMIPRTTLAQSMDILSSMASIAGYKAVLEAARLLPRYLPMMITAAGSIRPAKVLILGAGVAGLQAIATARRLGAQVEAFDTRSAAKDEVQSLGAKFVEVEGAKDDSEAGGYAVEQSEAFLKRQRAEVQARAIKSDIIITTAQVRGRKAPLLVPASTVEQMKPGSVIVDLASSTGGNCELSEDNKTVQQHGVYIVGNSNLSALMPQDASQLYSNNVVNFLKLIAEEGQLKLDLDNEIISGAYITAEPAAATEE